MKLIKALVEQLKQPKFTDRYPQFSTDDGMVHVLYFHPYLNGTGLHRALIPALHLNATKTHRACVTGIMPWDINRQRLDDEQSIEITYETRQLLAWANYVVFPMYMHDIKPMLDEFRQINPGLQFVMDVDDLVTDYPPAHPMHGRFPNSEKDQFIRNLQAMNVVTGSTEYLLRELEPVIGLGPDLFHLPNLMSSVFMEGIEPPPPTVNSKLPTVLLTANPGQWADINPLKKILAPLVKSKKIELVLFGWNGINRHMNNSLSGIPHKYIAPVPVTEYFSRMASINADLAIMPLQDNRFNRAKSHHKLLHYAMLGIPAVVDDVSAYTDFVYEEHEPNQIGKIRAMVARTNAQWTDHILRLAENPAGRELICAENQRLVRDENMIDTEIFQWQNCFCA